MHDVCRGYTDGHEMYRCECRCHDDSPEDFLLSSLPRTETDDPPTRIRWEETKYGGLTGHVGTVDGFLFQVRSPVLAGREGCYRRVPRRARVRPPRPTRTT